MKKEKKFKSAKEMLAYLWEDGDLYNYITGQYLFAYNDAGAIAIYRISLDNALYLTRMSYINDGEYWGAFLGPGGNIIEAEDAFSFCEELFALEGWIDTKDVLKWKGGYAA